MSTVDAIYEDGVFRPVGPVDLPEHSRVRVHFEPAEDGESEAEILDAIYEVLARRCHSGEADVAERHNEHQP